MSADIFLIFFCLNILMSKKNLLFLWLLEIQWTFSGYKHASLMMS